MNMAQYISEKYTGFGNRIDCTKLKMDFRQKCLLILLNTHYNLNPLVPDVH